MAQVYWDEEETQEALCDNCGGDLEWCEMDMNDGETVTPYCFNCHLAYEWRKGDLVLA